MPRRQVRSPHVQQCRGTGSPLRLAAPLHSRVRGGPVRVGIARERRTGERRVAATPETVRQLVGLGLEVLVEHGAGEASGHSDAAYEQAGAAIVDPLGARRPRRAAARASARARDAGAAPPRGRHHRPRRRPRPNCPPCARCATRGSPRSRSSWCRASPARSRWTRSPARRSSPATGACSRRPCGSRGSSRST